MEAFGIDEKKLRELAATRGGRIALNGFEYQRAFAVLRLTSMVLGRAVSLVDEHVPARLRYEWAEDIDEIDRQGRIVLWQCKLGEQWSTASKLAELLLGFAPKWLWTAPDQRHRLSFRLVTADPAYKAHARNAEALAPDRREDTRAHFLAALTTVPGDRADRARWQDDADAAGHDALFDALWSATRVLYIPNEPTRDAPDRRFAEHEAVKELATARPSLLRGQDVIDAALQGLRALLSVMPIGAPQGDDTIARVDQAPQHILPHHVADRLYPFAPRLNDSGTPLELIDRTRLLELQQRASMAWFVARRPEWSDVVGGGSAGNGFFERSVTTALVDQLRAALVDSRSREGRLRVQWLVGAPGTGKSTLALRAAAVLTLEGACLVVDARFSLAKEGDQASALADAIRALANDERPLLLLLDDPFGAGSGWPDVLAELGRKASAIVVLAATPDLLLENSEHALQNIAERPRHKVIRPDEAERLALARIYPQRHEWLMASEEDLLVLAMEASSGESFDAIVRGIWRTLNGGAEIPRRALGRELDWQVAAFMLVVYFHRAYAVCPLPLLESFLEARAAPDDAIGEALLHLKNAQGWSIFQTHEPDRKLGRNWAGVSSMHARVAEVAWACRPADAWQLEKPIAEASVKAAGSARMLGSALAALHVHARQEPSSRMPAFLALMGEIATAWSEAPAHAIETRNLFSLILQCKHGGVPIADQLRETLRRRVALFDAQSWLAELALGALAIPRLETPDRAHLSSLLESADFSIAAGRAISFGLLLKEDKALHARFIDRLWAIIDERADGGVNSGLITWLLTNADSASIQKRLPTIRIWLTGHAAGHTVRTALISWMKKAKSPELPAYLSECIKDLGAERSAYTPASAAFVALGTLDLAHAQVMVPWMNWASAMLERSRGDRSAQIVANSIHGVLTKSRAHARALGAKPASKVLAAQLSDARSRLEAAHAAWQAALKTHAEPAVQARRA
ncbi:hypothetical protein CDN99_10030 [Roseateles aquatilis]|uniref:AAA+ ATPase domain-containing protein n=1 Tax=Roseateles aquatilis TaxID=431061 RepID=A0A246JG09_9BURK|nr:hypothetical protein [Roseateles aquatilis]OWQ91480.1 hypothetical protein CDN99_10030 [Roseateles aquatilis]